MVELLPRRPLLCGVSLKKTGSELEMPPVVAFLILDAGKRKREIQEHIAKAEVLFEVEQATAMTYEGVNVRAIAKEG